MILNDGRIVATARPAFPWAVQHTNTRNNRRIWVADRPVPLNYEIPMAWHHIIPWKDLRNGWSALATSGRWEIIEVWADLWNLADTKAVIKSMKNGTLAAPHNATMLNKLCWSEWNLVEGPDNNNRTDDPGSEALDIFGGLKMPNNVRDRSNTLNLIYTLIRCWPANRANITKNEAKPLIGYFKALKKYKNSPISRFDPKVWCVVDAGRFNKFGVADKHSTWKKVS